jgi:two-component system, cell cycle sensor histidine kinase and response regulator CckA
MTTPSSNGKGVAKTILFADNDPILLDAIPELLQTKGYEVHTTQDGLETLQAIRRLRPGYVILDIVMPKLDGSRVCWLIRQDPDLKNTPIIAFSALSPDQIRRFPELSADAYVAKGPLGVVANNLLTALKYLDEHGRGDFEGGIFGYEGFQSRRLISEMLGLKRYWETLFRIFEQGILGLDEDARVLLVNPAASRLFERKEARIIGEPLPALLAPRDRQPVQRMLGELKKARLPEDRHMEVTVGELPVRLRAANLVEDGACTGLLVILEANPPREKVPRGAASK